MFDTGPVIGAAAAIDAFQPSLMPTPSIDRGVAAGASWVTAGLVAGAIDATLRAAARRLGTSSVIVRAAAAAAGIGAARSLRNRDGEPLGRAAARTGAAAVAVTAGAGVAVGAARALIDRGATVVPGGRMIAPVAASLAGAAGYGALLRDRLRRYERDGSTVPEPRAVAEGLAVAVGLASTVLSAVSGERAAVRAVVGSAAPAQARPFGVAAGHAAVVGGLGVVALVALRRLLHRFEEANNAVEAAYSEPPPWPAVTAGPGSTVPWATLGLQGRRFVSETTQPDRIRIVMGEEPRATPCRLYIGFRSANSMQDRVALAVEELRRANALERSVLIVASPSGTGYINPIAIEAAEYMARGDVATVSVQYAMRPSLLATDRVTPGGRHHRALLEAIRAECARIGVSPRIVVYGESLGAHAGQNAFLHRGTNGPSELGVSAALYVGTPYRSKWKEQLFRDERADVDRSSFGRFDSIADVLALDPPARQRLAIFFLDHANDPVTRFGIDLAVQRPEWLGSERAPSLSATQQWTPVVTFWQTAIDTKNAARVVPGQFDATGHDYRADLAAFVRVAYRFDDVSDAQMDAIEGRLRRSETERAVRIEQG